MRFFSALLIILLLSVPAWALPNEVEYTIRAELFPDQNVIIGDQSVRFTNMTDGPLDQLHFHLYPNAFKRDNFSQYQQDLLQHAGAAALDSLYASPEDDAFIEIQLIQSEGQSLSYEISDTLLSVDLPRLLGPGESIEVDIHFLYDMMEGPARDLMAFTRAVRSAHRNGVFTVSLWYPKLAVYDEDGWFLEPYRLFGEFYGDFASFDVQITLPSQFEVGATGTLELEAVEGGSKTLLFKAADVHDFAWVASDRFQSRSYELDGVRIKALYVDEFLSDMGELAADALEYYSGKFGPYPYEQYTIAQVKVGGGMEYPMLAVIGQGNDSEIVHEVAHQWWYGAVGNNEMTETWLDEGFTTFSEELFFIEHQGRSETLVRSSRVFIEPGEIVLQPAYQFSSLTAFGRAVYTKGSGILWMLRSYVGAERFDEMMRAYFDASKLSNTTTSEYTAFVSDYMGEDLTWFFDQWLKTTAVVDYAVRDVQSTRNASGEVEHTISVENLGDAHMPVTIQIYPEGEGLSPLRVQWDGQSAIQEIRIDEFESISGVEIDPDRAVLENNRSNNSWFAQFGLAIYAVGLAYGLFGLIALRTHLLRR